MSSQNIIIGNKELLYVCTGRSFSALTYQKETIWSSSCQCQSNTKP